MDKEFNTLDAQREACEAYVASQRAEGWVLVRDRYDDGGFSGGTLERPALKRLLTDIEAGLVDVIVVYKIDRLSRSLMDFAKLVETFEAHRVTFVSVTQSFNTTTSMGRAHAILQISPRTRAAQNRQHAPALLKGLIFGLDGRALSPTHSMKNGRLYRYYVAQAVLKGGADPDDGLVRRVSAAEIEAAVVDQVRALLRQPEVVVGTWLAARAEAPGLKEAEVREALARLDPLWGELFPAEQARIIRALVERVVVGPDGADIRLRLDGLGALARDLGTVAPAAFRAAA